MIIKKNIPDNIDEIKEMLSQFVNHKKKNKNTALLFISIVIAIIVGGIVWWVVNKNNKLDDYDEDYDDYEDDTCEYCRCQETIENEIEGNSESTRNIEEPIQTESIDE